MEYQHIPVLTKQIVDTFAYLDNREKVVFVDGTLGLAGHSLELAGRFEELGLNFKIIGIDKDQSALKIAEKKITAAGFDQRFEMIHDDFNRYSVILENIGIDAPDGILLDLGVSSMQLDDKSRGFSFSDESQPLDMRMDRDQKIDAAFILNNYEQKELERILRNGEEWRYRKIARRIMERRQEKEIKTVGDLVEILGQILPKYGKTHFATDTFRALRIEVNGEISRLSKTIEEMADSLKPKSRLAIITFHSLEDRIVKDKFKELANPCVCPPKQPHCICGRRAEVEIVTKKPLTADDSELAANPRSRSAKLRVIEKVGEAALG